MAKSSVGIDCGSAACKGILMQEGVVVASCAKPTGWNPRETAFSVLQDLLAQADCSMEDSAVIATGYGRVGIPFANKAVTEITCHARGAEFLLPGVRTVIDIGGQDSKVISVEQGRVLSFQMNDKCAAGTGRFLEMSAHRMGVDLREFPTLLAAGQSCPLSSMCAVFADSEIVSLLASGKSREAVAGGIVHAIVARVIALAAKVDIASPVLLTGGMAEVQGLPAILEQRIGLPVVTAPLSRFAGAIGAACYGASSGF